MKDFGKMVMKIPKEIRDYVADLFIARASYLNVIAFMEWRKMYKKSLKTSDSKFEYFIEILKEIFQKMGETSENEKISYMKSG